MVGLEAEREFLLGFTPCGMFEIVLRPGKFFFSEFFFTQILSILNKFNV